MAAFDGMVGIWSDDRELVAAAKKSRDAGFSEMEAITPFPLHEIDEILSIPRSPLPYVTFVFGSLGCAFGIWFTWWTSAVDWPLNIGGKPFFSAPAFVPIWFELTILFAALSSVAGCFMLCGLPKVDPPIIDKDLTSHKFALMISKKDPHYNPEKIERLFRELGAKEVRSVTGF